MTMAGTARRAHERCVDGWLARCVVLDSSQELAQLLFRATDALWAHAVPVLGNVTLNAIFTRVLRRAEAHYPFAASAYGKSPARRAELEQAVTIPASELVEGIRFVLVELLAVLGTLTAEILTPELHAALHEVAPDRCEALEVGGWRPALQIAKDAS